MLAKHWSCELCLVTMAVALLSVLSGRDAYAQCPQCDVGATEWPEEGKVAYIVRVPKCDGTLAEPWVGTQASTLAIAHDCLNPTHDSHYAKAYARTEGRRYVEAVPANPEDVWLEGTKDALLMWVLTLDGLQSGKGQMKATLIVGGTSESTDLPPIVVTDADDASYALEVWHTCYDGATVKIFYEAISEAWCDDAKQGIRAEVMCYSTGGPPAVEVHY